MQSLGGFCLYKVHIWTLFFHLFILLHSSLGQVHVKYERACKPTKVFFFSALWLN